MVVGRRTQVPEVILAISGDNQAAGFADGGNNTHRISHPCRRWGYGFNHQARYSPEILRDVVVPFPREFGMIPAMSRSPLPRSSRSRAGLVLGVLLLALGSLPGFAAETRKPNIVLI